MILSALKVAVLAAMQERPEVLKSQRFAEADPIVKKGLLRWLHESGLALYLSEHVDCNADNSELPYWLTTELQRGRKANLVRTKALLEQFRHVNSAMAGLNIRYAVLKGFSLSPEFCISPFLRHQTDIDLLIHPDDLNRAVAELVQLGYRVEGRERSGEVRLATPAQSEPRRDDDLYAVPKQWQVELHQSVFESANGVSIEVGSGWEDAVVETEVEGIDFPCLNLPHRLLIQSLHAFRHVLHGWLRLGWLYEIHQFIGQREIDVRLWSEFESLAERDPRLQHACGLTLELSRRLFGTRLPAVLQGWCNKLPEPVRLWCAEYGVKWALADFPGNRLSLLVHREFVDEPAEWRKFQYERSGRTLGAITAKKVLSVPFLLAELRERLDYLGHYLRWRRLRSHILMKRKTVQS